MHVRSRAVWAANNILELAVNKMTRLALRSLPSCTHPALISERQPPSSRCYASLSIVL